MHFNVENPKNEGENYSYEVIKEATINAQAKVGFKTGSEEKLFQLSSEEIEIGTFYLTNDSNRLYIGKQYEKNGKAINQVVPINEGVITVADVAALPTFNNSDFGNDAIALTNFKQKITGRFYYCTAQNILCVYNGQEWVQINPYTKITKFSIGSTKNHSLDTPKKTVNEKKYYGSETLSLEIGTDKEADKDHHIVALGITGENGISIRTSGSSSTNNENEEIVIRGTTYAINSDLEGGIGEKHLKINLSDTDVNENSSSVALYAGKGLIFDEANGKISLGIQGDGIQFSPDGVAEGYEVKIGDLTSKNVFDPIIKLHDKSVHHFIKGTNTLPVYTVNEIDSQFRTLNAMTFKGSLGTDYEIRLINKPGDSIGLKKVSASGTLSNPSASELQKINININKIKIGDTYLVDQYGVSIYEGNNEIKSTMVSGSLIVASGVEYDTIKDKNSTETDPNKTSEPDLIGYINPSTLSWIGIEGTYNTNTTYTMGVEKGGLVADDSNNNIDVINKDKEGVIITFAENGTNNNTYMAIESDSLSITDTNGGLNDKTNSRVNIDLLWGTF